MVTISYEEIAQDFLVLASKGEALEAFTMQKPLDPGAARIHIFWFENGKIVDLWDFGQTVPAEKVNENGMF